MTFNFSDSKSLLQNAVEEKLYDKLVTQLDKDFVLANIFFDLPKGISADALEKTLHEKIYVLLMEKFTEYLNLLYVVDVPEKSFKKIKVTDTVEVAEQVSFLILLRELQKVWLKQKYSV